MKTSHFLSFSLAIALCAGCSSGEGDSEARPDKQATRAAAEPAPAQKLSAPAPEPTPPPAPAPVEPVAAAPAAPPADAAAPGVALAEREGVSLGSLVIARGVDKRQPVEPGTSFSLAGGNKLYAVMDVKNPEKTAAELSVAWLPEGGDKERGAVTLSVGEQPKWRTWAFHSGFRKPGRWAAIVRDATGAELGRATFDVTE
jgi:hypothetical protein